MSHFPDLPRFDEAHALVVGDVMLDRYWAGPASRVSPEAPVPIVKIQECSTRPGGAANVALNLATIGCHVDLLGVVGCDAEGKDLEAQLSDKNVHCFFQHLAEGHTVSKLRVISRNQQMLRLDFESLFEDFDAEALLKAYEKQLKKANLVVFSDYGKGTLKKIPELIARARARGVPIFIDPKGNDYRLYSGATMVTPNLSEFEAVVGPCRQDENLLIAKAKALIQSCDFSAILVTRGQEGMTLVFAGDRKTLHLTSQAREVFDVTGAGDTVIALMAASVAVGVDYDRAAYLANLAAGLVVRKLGTAVVTVPELRDALRHEYGVSQGVLSEALLLSIVADAQSKGEKIVMTNGCFDILHPGHIQYLEQAKALGDRLIVAVNTDDSVSRLKGPERPVNPLGARMEVLSGLRAVDWVVPFSEDTPERLIQAILPDVLVKGGDYTVETVAGHKIVLQAGGDVVILPLREGYSTTQLFNKVRG